MSEPKTGDMTEMASEGIDEPFRFFDNREKYLLFVTTTSEKAVTAERIGREFDHIDPSPPALRMFDAGTGNGDVLSRVLREAHARFPNVPTVVVGKEISLEDTRMCLDRLADRLAEHPQLVFVITNLNYTEAPHLVPNKEEVMKDLQWWDVPLKGTTGHELSHEVQKLDPILQQGWQTKQSQKTGNPLYAKPSVLVLYRDDQKFALDSVIPQKGRYDEGYDLIVAAQPYRSRGPADFKVNKILGPLALNLAEKGRMIVVQSTGHDPGMEIIRSVWPDEAPFATPRHVLLKGLTQFFKREGVDFHFEGEGDQDALFTYHLHTLPDEVGGSRIGTSTLLAAWNAAVYVAQIDDDRLEESYRSGVYDAGTTNTLQQHGGLWFQDESFVVVRTGRKS